MYLALGRVVSQKLTEKLKKYADLELVQKFTQAWFLKTKFYPKVFIPMNENQDKTA